MARREVIGDCELWLGDCREILPTIGRVDSVVTDPPYGIGDRMKGGTWGAAQKYADFRSWDTAPDNETFERILSLSDDVIIWGGNYFRLSPARCWLIWNKTNAVHTMADFEMAWTSLDRPCKAFAGPVGNHEWGHPTEKPLALMQWCVLMTAGTVLDPFAGVATTGVACARLGRRFIGIEIHEPYFDIACRRVEAAYRQRDLFIDQPSPPKPVQMDLSA